MGTHSTRRAESMSRYAVLLVTAAIAISYFDRQTLPVAISAIQRTIPVSNQQFSYLQTAFLLAYAALYAIGGRLLEKRNYLNLAGSKLRACSLGPELVLDPAFGDLRGEVRIEREGAILWSRKIASGEDNLAHSLANLEHHHFKFAGHRQPGGAHVHFFGADALSFGDGIELREGDIAELRFDGFGRALRNPIRQEIQSATPVRVVSLP